MDIIKHLEKNFYKKGFYHEQLLSDHGVYIYKRTDKDGNYHYEVIVPSLVRLPNYMQQYDINKGYTHRYYYPSDEQFGSKGWTFRTLEKAVKKYLEQRDKNILYNLDKLFRYNLN